MKEQLYNDFLTKVLPKIQEGLVIGQEYFIDIFGRYIKYLIIVNSIGIVISIPVIVVGIILLKKAMVYETKDWSDDTKMWFYSGALSLIGVGLTTLIFNTVEIVKAVYIPEVRIYEEIKSQQRN